MNIDTKKLDALLVDVLQLISEVDCITDVGSGATETDAIIGTAVITDLMEARRKLVAMRNVRWPDYAAFQAFMAESEALPC